MYRKTTNEVLSPRVDMALLYAEERRIWIYLGLFGLFNIYQMYKEYRRYQFEQLQFEILEKSYELDDGSLSGLFKSLGLGDEEGDDDLKITLDGQQQEVLRLALDDYIKERQSTYETGQLYDEMQAPPEEEE